jgi:tetratricopeptide (TPR) repeat protein
MEESMNHVSVRRTVGAIALACVFAVSAAPSAQAGICFTSGKVYVQQKVWDKACHFLECARREEPENLQVYSLLAVARAQQRQYASAGAAMAMGLKLADSKKDAKRQKEIESNRDAVFAQLYNQGLAALNRAGNLAADPNRTTGDETTPQGKVEKAQGLPKEFGRYTESGKVHEYWYYPDKGVGYHFAPDMTEALEFPYKPYAGPPSPEVAIADTTIFPAYDGSSRVEEAAYSFMLASYIEPKSADNFKNLSYVFEILGRADEAIAAARMGLTIKPDDQQLMRNMRVAVMGPANRAFTAGNYAEAIRLYRIAKDLDPASKLIYSSQIADSWYNWAGKFDKGPEKTAKFDSAAVAYMALLNEAPAESTTMRENALYNSAVIYSNLENYKEAVRVLDKAVELYPKNKELLSLSGQTKYQSDDAAGAVVVLKKALEIDPADQTVHQFLFLSYTKLKKQDESVAEYTVYKALSEGKQKVSPALKVWVDSAGNRLGPGQQITKTVAAEGYPDEVRTYPDGDKQLECFFYWGKGKAITFLNGQHFSTLTFPAKKS